MSETIEYTLEFIAESLILSLVLLLIGVIGPYINILVIIYFAYLIYIAMIDKLPLTYLLFDLWN